MGILMETIGNVLLGNREIAIRNTEKGIIVVSVTGFNKLQNIKMCHSYKIEDESDVDEKQLAYIIKLLNDSIE